MNWTAIALIAALVVAVGCELEPAGQSTQPSAESRPAHTPETTAKSSPEPTPSAIPTLTPAPKADATERNILVALYNAANGANWIRNDNWLSDKPVGEWRGVETDDGGRVVELHLYNNQLSGEIPPELGELSHLRQLWLDGNQLSGTIPPELGELAHLKVLELGENQLSGAIPPELGDLAKLEGLALYNNQLSGEIPPEIGNLANLEELELSENQLSGGIPPEFGGLSNMVELHLNNNQLSGEIPPEIGNLANLEELELSDNQLSGAIPGIIGDKKALTALYESTDGANWLNNYNWLSDHPVSEWHGVETNGDGRVVELSLDGNGLSGEIPLEIAYLAYLRELDLSSNRLTGCIPNGLRRSVLVYVTTGLPFCPASPEAEAALAAERDALVALYESADGANWLNNDNWLSDRPIWEWHGVHTIGDGRVAGLYLNENNLRGEIPAELGDLSHLTEVYMRGNQLSEEIPLEIGNLSKLIYLYLSDNQLTGEIPPEIGNLSWLRWLMISDNHLSGEIPQEIGDLSHLEELELSGNWLTGDIPPELGNLSNLAELSLHGNQLTGCVPESLRQALNDDAALLGLPFCEP